MGAVSLDAWLGAGTTFLWRGHAIYTRVDGSGEPLLLIHGFPTASWDWSPIWSRLAARYRVITLDMLGFGFSAKPRDHGYRIADQADLIEAVLAREGIARCRVLAHDYGVTVTQELLARQRERSLGVAIEAIVFLNGGLFPESHQALFAQRLLASRLGPIMARMSGFRTFSRSLRRIWGDRPIPEDELAAMWELVTLNDGVAVLPPLLSYLAQRRAHRTRWVGALVDTPIPRRLIDGLRDPVSGTTLVARYRELVPGPDVVELPTVGHYPQLEAPDAVLAATLAHFGCVL